MENTIWDNKVFCEVLDQNKTKIVAKAIGKTIGSMYLVDIMEKSVVFTQKYGITLTFKSKFTMDDPKKLHRMIANKLLKSRVWQGHKYILFPEFTSSGSLHYHGIIWDTYEVDLVRMAQWWRRTFGYVKLEKDIKYYYCGTPATQECSQKNKKNKKIKCWLHYITKDVGKVGLWTHIGDI